MKNFHPMSVSDSADLVRRCESMHQKMVRLLKLALFWFMAGSAAAVYAVTRA